MFCQLKHTLKYVNVQPCHRGKCACYKNFAKRATKETLKITSYEFQSYKSCRKSNHVQSRDVFLL